MGRKERKRYENNDRVRELLTKDTLSPDEIEFIKQSYTGVGGLASSGWDNGQFFTPSVVTQFTMLMMGIEGGRVLEPSCGSGAFLNVLHPDCDVYGIEMMRETAHVAELCYPNATIIQGDALQVEWDEPFDYVVGNPPYGLRVDNWDFLCGKKLKSEVAFIEYGLKNLKPGGILGMVIPDSILANSKEVAFRKWILDSNRLLGVVSLPTTTFYHTGTSVKTSLLMIEKGVSHDPNYQVFMAMANKIGWDNRGNKIEENDLVPILHEYLSFEESHINRRKKQPVLVDQPAAFAIELIESAEKKAVAGQMALAI